jgi:hypothetical protein
MIWSKREDSLYTAAGSDAFMQLFKYVLMFIYLTILSFEIVFYCIEIIRKTGKHSALKYEIKNAVRRYSKK